MTEPQFTVIIPAYNEQDAIPAVIKDVQSTCTDFLHEIIVVDDGSSDGTAAAISGLPGVRLIRHKRNRGYGEALKTGIRAAQTDLVLIMDSDGQHSAQDVVSLYHEIGDQDMVVGQRTTLIHSNPWRMPGKWLLNWMANYLTKQRIPDLNSGMRIMRREVVRRYMHLCPSGFSFSTTITMALLMRGYAVSYKPISIRRRVGKSTVSVSTGLQTIMLIVRIAALFDPLRIFLPLGLFAIFIGLLWGVPYSLRGLGISVGAMLAIMTGFLTLGLGILCDQISQLRLERFESRD